MKINMAWQKAWHGMAVLLPWLACCCLPWHGMGLAAAFLRKIHDSNMAWHAHGSMATKTPAAFSMLCHSSCHAALLTACLPLHCMPALPLLHWYAHQIQSGTIIDHHHHHDQALTSLPRLHPFLLYPHLPSTLWIHPSLGSSLQIITSPHHHAPLSPTIGKQKLVPLLIRQLQCLLAWQWHLCRIRPQK